MALIFDEESEDFLQRGGRYGYIAMGALSPISYPTPPVTGHTIICPLGHKQPQVQYLQFVDAVVATDVETQTTYISHDEITATFGSF